MLVLEDLVGLRESESEVTQSCPTLCDRMDCSLSGSSIHGIFQERILELGCHFFLQRIFVTQGLNWGLLHCRQVLYYLSHQEHPWEYHKFIFGFWVELEWLLWVHYGLA